MFAPSRHALFRLENGYYLLFYHRQAFYTMFGLYLRYLAPIVILAYLIKKNPFYKTYPIMLPIMMAAILIVFYRMIKYSSRTNRMVH